MNMLLMIPALLFSVIIHEVAHGYVAYRCGDETAKLQGRLTLNPLPHIDVFGTLIFPALLIVTRAPILFGWAKPVPVNPYNMRNPKKHHLFVSMAGIAANLALAVVCTLLYGFAVNVFTVRGGEAIMLLLQYAIQINIILAVFNAVPIPPLDGSWILYHLLPERLANSYRRIFPYGFVILILLLLTNVIHSIIVPVYGAVLKLLSLLLAFIIQ